jgi:AraC-like DNA-binding protein
MFTVEFLRHLAISQVILLGVSALLYHRDSYTGRLLALFAVCMTCYLAFPLMDLSQSKTASFLIGRLGFATPAVIWLIAYALFADNPKVPLWIWSSIAAYMVLRAIGSIYFYVAPTDPFFSIEYFFFYLTPYLLRLGMCAHMIFLALNGRENDLVELRRRARAPFVLILGGFFTLMTIDSAFSLTLEMSTGVPVTLSALQHAIDFLLFPAMLAVNAVLFRITFEKFGGTISKDSAMLAGNHRDELDEKDIAVRDRVLSVMENDKLYTKSGLTIGELAKTIDVQEYKLRSIINRHLGFSNFSHFLNGYRIHEAEQKLLNSSDSIFNIGLDVGYTSLSSFHKAFKEAHGVTPKEFRVLNRTHPKSV